jgi:hypothetical protein
MGLELATALRPQGVGQLVDGGYQALRSHPRLLLGSAALFLVPVTVLVAVLGRGGPTPGLITAGSPAAGLVGVAGYSLATALMGLPLANAVNRLAAGEEPTLRAALRLPVRTWAAAVAAWAVMTVAKVVGAAVMGFPFIAVVVLALPLSPVLAIECLGPFAAVRRSFGLAAKGFGRCLAVVALTALATAAILGALAIPLALASNASEEWRRPLATIVQLGIGLIVTPTAAFTAALTYVDLRVRHEGLDLRMELQRLSAVPLAARG